jgi:hypothetical protein
MPGRGWVIALLLAAAVAGCGSGGETAQPGLTNRQAAGLVAQLEAVRSSAGAANVAATEAALSRFRAAVARLRRTGALSDATARRLRIGAARVLARVKSDSAPEPPPTPAPAPALPPGQAKKHEDKKPHGDKKPPGKDHAHKHPPGEGGD